EKQNRGTTVKQLIYLISTIGRSRSALPVCLATLGLGLSAAADAPRRTFTTPQAPPQVQYTVIELGVGVANAIDGPGRIVGSHLFGAERHAALWRNSQSPPIDLGTLPGFTSSFAADINPPGEIVGAAGSFPTFRPL